VRSCCLNCCGWAIYFDTSILKNAILGRSKLQ